MPQDYDREGTTAARRVYDSVMCMGMEAYSHAGDFCWMVGTLLLRWFVGLVLFSGIIWGGLCQVAEHGNTASVEPAFIEVYDDTIG